ncbi:MAG: hypothetical protein D3910_04955 [Candidatus Electrothrix sp. ATG2]|nr:hypothetical protein [Candidatus Electrothrix sp. ATG2]
MSNPAHRFCCGRWKDYREEGVKSTEIKLNLNSFFFVRECKTTELAESNTDLAPFFCSIRDSNLRSRLVPRITAASDFGL